MRILYLIDSPSDLASPSGRHVALGLARMAQRDGCQVSVAAVHASAALDADADAVRLIDGIPLTSWPLSPSLESAARFRQWAAEQAFDIVHVFEHTAVQDAHQVLSELSMPRVVSLMGEPCELEAGQLQRLQSASARLAPSEFAAGFWRQQLTPTRVRVLPHGVDLLGLIRAEATVGGNPGAQPALPTLACCAPFDPSSGVEVLLQALGRLPDLALRLLLRGRCGDDNVQVRRLRALVTADTRVQLELIHGDDQDQGIGPLLGRFDLLCVPTLQAQDFAWPVHECAAAGRHCLASNLGDAAEAVRRWRCGSLVPAGDVTAWAQAIAHWFTAQQAGAAARRAGMNLASGMNTSMGTSIGMIMDTSMDMAMPVPHRLEEQAFLVQSLYRAAVRGAQAGPTGR